MTRLMNITCAATMLMTCITHARPQDFNYIRKDTREESRRATLAQYVPPLDWSDWWVIGPFDNTDRDKHGVVYPPELGVDYHATATGKRGQTVSWRRLQTTEGQPINLLMFDREADRNDAIAYLHRQVIVQRDTRLQVQMGSDDGLKFWLNGRLLVDADVYRGLDVMAHTVELPLQVGTNDILVKVTQGAGDWSFQMRTVVDPRILARLDYHLNKDFPVSPEDRHYRLLSVIEPEDIVLEVGGLDVLPDGRPIVTTRRGEAWIIEGAYDDPPFDCEFTRFAFGLHEPLGARWVDDGLLVVQRGELTRLTDTDGDERADMYQTVSDAWGVSGNYHEFAFGPKFDGQGRTWVTLNVGFCGSLGKSVVPWRGWAMIIEPDGSLTPVCGGLRSPNGIGRNAAGDMFFTDNQGDWIGTNKLSHLDFGDWHGHPAGDEWYDDAGMEPPQGEQDFKPPAVWFPYDTMGRSASDIELDDTGGQFGPFEGQLFIGDQYSAIVMRVFLEQINGVYQGACFPFRNGLDCGVNRLRFAPDGSLFAGMTNRGWWSFGTRPWGVQRIVYTGVLPFEILEMRVQPDGFELEFTKPVDTQTVSDISNYQLERYTYHRWETYGSPEIERAELTVRRVDVSDDRRRVRLTIDGLHTGFVHELHVRNLLSEDGDELLHDAAYYTVNVIPEGE